MKQVLSLLTAFVFLQMQTWALSGGPVFRDQASPNLAGVYSGVLVQGHTKFGDDFVTPNTNTHSPQDPPAGNIGVYTVNVPITGLATGTFLLFINGTIFTGGTISGVADPDKTTFQGVMQAAANLTTPAGVNLSIDARGQMKTKIIENKRKPLPGRPDLTTGVAARMEGKATVDAFDFTSTNLAPLPVVQTTYSVSGYRQSTTALP